MSNPRESFAYSALTRGALSLCLMTLALAACGAIAGAQSPILRGVVRDSASREPISGAVIMVLDSAGQPSSSTIAGADGRFRIARSAASKRIRARRIGFRPREIPIPGGAVADTAELEITMGRIPQILASVRVIESSHCPGSTANGEAAQLWSQARDGLLASIVARDAKPASIQTLTFDRATAPRDGLVLSHRHRIQAASRTTRTFKARASAAVFAERGYVQEDGGDRVFDAPDADVLLDESFTATHCFRLVPGSGARVDQIGLAFAPTRRRRGIADVEGVLWLDRAKPALRTLEFRYTELDGLTMAARAGGTVDFETMDNGVVIITRWSLRMPVLAARARRSDPPSPWNTRREASDISLAEIRESGGLVIAATWPDGVRWTQPVGALTGTVIEQVSRKPIAHALVTFAGAWDTVATDTAGRFVVTTVLAGRYDVVALDTSLIAYVEERSVRRTIDVQERGTNDVTFELPAKDESIRRLCADARMRPQSSVLLGRIRRADGGAPGKLEVRVAWQDDFVVSGGSIGVGESKRTIEPDSVGRFHVCGVVRERPIRITVQRNGLTIADTAVFVYDTVVARVDLLIPPSDGLYLSSTDRVPCSSSRATTGPGLLVEDIRAQVGPAGPDDRPGLVIDRDLVEDGGIIQWPEDPSMPHDPTTGVHAAARPIGKPELQPEPLQRPNSNDAGLPVHARLHVMQISDLSISCYAAEPYLGLYREYTGGS